MMFVICAFCEFVASSHRYLEVVLGDQPVLRDEPVVGVVVRDEELHHQVTEKAQVHESVDDKEGAEARFEERHLERCDDGGVHEQHQTQHIPALPPRSERVLQIAGDAGRWFSGCANGVLDAVNRLWPS